VSILLSFYECSFTYTLAPVSTVDHIEALKAKHASLEHAIDQENTRPHPDDDAICSLKKRKLQIKDEIARLTASSTRH
jgi:hypothetical protein